MPRVLIADDQPAVIEALRLLLKGEGFETRAVASPADAAEALSRQSFDVALIDLNYTRDTTSGQEGLDLLARLRELDPTLPVVVMTAWGSVEVAVEAMQRGARDFVQKPWDNARLLTILRTHTELSRALRKGERLEAENKMLREDGERPLLIAESEAMQPVLDLLRHVGPSDANVLITGENGTGKEIVARTLHALSNRASKSMVAVNAGALAEGTFESELFGHVRGAYTDAKTDRVGRFELADGGTLFLDEIANVPVNLQPKLLRVLETGEYERVGSSQTRRVDVRVLSATNSNLKEESAAGRFRQDLFFRLNTVEIHLPPLRERPEDVEPIARHLLARLAGPNAPELTPEVLSALRSYAWPGNVRQLRNTLERAVLLANDGRITTSELPPEIVSPALAFRPVAAAPAPGGDAAQGAAAQAIPPPLREVERQQILAALEQTGWHRGKTAEMLGISPSTLYRRLRDYNLTKRQ